MATIQIPYDHIDLGEQDWLNTTISVEWDVQNTGGAGMVSMEIHANDAPVGWSDLVTLENNQGVVLAADGYLSNESGVIYKAVLLEYPAPDYQPSEIASHIIPVTPVAPVQAALPPVAAGIPPVQVGGVTYVTLDADELALMAQFWPQVDPYTLTDQMAQMYLVEAQKKAAGVVVEEPKIIPEIIPTYTVDQTLATNLRQVAADLGIPMDLSIFTSEAQAQKMYEQLAWQRHEQDQLRRQEEARHQQMLDQIARDQALEDAKEQRFEDERIRREKQQQAQQQAQQQLMEQIRRDEEREEQRERIQEQQRIQQNRQMEEARVRQAAEAESRRIQARQDYLDQQEANRDAERERRELEEKIRRATTYAGWGIAQDDDDDDDNGYRGGGYKEAPSGNGGGTKVEKVSGTSGTYEAKDTGGGHDWDFWE